MRPWRAQGAWKAAGWRGAGRLQPAPFFPLDPQVPRDVVLFQHDRRGFFRLMGLFCAGQGLFWGYLAHFAFHTLSHSGATPESTQKEAGPDPEQAGGRPKPTLPGGASLNLGSDKWRLGFTASCLTIASLILVAGFVFSRRSVGRILLRRGGQDVTLTTYYPFGLTSAFTVPLREVSCVSHRSEVPAMIPLKVKGKPFYFLLDKQGQITNPKLFDITVGAYRKL